MVPVVEINGISEIPDAVCLGVPERLAESASLQLVGRFKELSAGGVNTFILDLGQTKSVTDAGLGAIHHISQQIGENLVFLRPNSKTQMLFKSVGLFAPIVGSIDEVQSQLRRE